MDNTEQLLLNNKNILRVLINPDRVVAYETCHFKFELKLSGNSAGALRIAVLETPPLVCCSLKRLSAASAASRRFSWSLITKL